MGLYRATWSVCGAVLAGSGVIVCLNALSWTESLSWAVVGSVVYCLAGYAFWKARGRRAGLALITYAVQGFVAVLALAGLITLLGAGGALISGLVLAAAPQVTGWWLPVVARRLGIAAPAATSGNPVSKPSTTAWVPKSETAAGVALLSDSELCLAWRRSSAVVDVLHRRRDMVRLTTVLANRHHYLDALELRDPVGFARWLSGDGQPPADPQRFINRRRGTTP